MFIISHQGKRLGLTGGCLQSSVQMETTYVTQLLRGTESGRYLALDLGSTNFRSVSGKEPGSGLSYKTS